MAPRPRPAFEDPLSVVCVDGEVVITGPEHLHGAFSIEAALRSAALLERTAKQARCADRPDDADRA